LCKALGGGCSVHPVSAAGASSLFGPTPRNPVSHARHIRDEVRKCPPLDVRGIVAAGLIQAIFVWAVQVQAGNRDREDIAFA